MSNINKYPKYIMRKFHKAEEKFYDIVEELEIFYEKRAEDFPILMLDHFSPLLSWSSGFSSAEETLDIVDKAGDLRNVAKAKVVKKLNKFLEKEMSRGVRYPVAENKLKNSIMRLETEVLESYVSYLELSKKYLEKIKEEEKNQIKVIYGSRIDKSEGVVWEPMTLNQAIKYIKHSIEPYCDNKYIMEDYLVTFESEWGTEWFLAPESYVKVFKKVFNINTNFTLGRDKKSFYSKISEAIEESA